MARVRLTQGNLTLGAGNVDTAVWDVVATDDFMYGEPLPLVTDAKLLNLSVRGMAGAGANSLIAGFVVGGTQPKSLLVRAIGPGLTAFGVAGAIANPALAIMDAAGQTLTGNDDWGNSAAVAQAANAVGAFPLAANSADAAAIVVLTPGAYSLQVTGAGGTSGVTLAEIYEIR